MAHRRRSTCVVASGACCSPLRCAAMETALSNPRRRTVAPSSTSGACYSPKRPEAASAPPPHNPWPTLFRPCQISNFPVNRKAVAADPIRVDRCAKRDHGRGDLVWTCALSADHLARLTPVGVHYEEEETGLPIDALDTSATRNDIAEHAVTLHGEKPRGHTSEVQRCIGYQGYGGYCGKEGGWHASELKALPRVRSHSSRRVLLAPSMDSLRAASNAALAMRRLATSRGADGCW
jgi:hypothetical protein